MTNDYIPPSPGYNLFVIAPALTDFANECHLIAKDKGWWPEELTSEQLASQAINGLSTTVSGDGLRVTEEDLVDLINRARETAPQNDGEKIALMHSELSEALEGLRAGNPPDDKVTEFSSVEVELADVIIRIFDLAGKREWDVVGAMLAKLQMNRGRPYRHGGKKF